jgi:hypothetical protein
MNQEKIFCDESNFTGSDLLNEAQPIFTYSTVYVSENEAENIVKNFLKTLPSQKNRKEVKSSIFSSPRGKSEGLKLIKSIANKIKLSVVDKKFALAGKFVETIIEPVIQDFNILMYQTGMHLYTANLLYGMHLKGDNILESFLSAVRKQDSQHFIKENSNHHLFGNYIKRNCSKISQEINLLKADKWSLDMTLTSLHTLLSLWYDQERTPLNVIYDPSKPIAANMDIIKSFNPKKSNPPLKYKLLGKEISFEYDLYSIDELDSKNSYGIMLADLVAGFLKLGEEVDDINLYVHAIIAGKQANFIENDIEEDFLSAQLHFLLIEQTSNILSYPYGWLEFAYSYIEDRHGLDAVNWLKSKHSQNYVPVT